MDGQIFGVLFLLWVGAAIDIPQIQKYMDKRNKQ
jgi:hypothetical protein